MKVLLLNSPIYDKKVTDKEDYLSPLGLGYIATRLKEEGIDVKIIDCVNDNLTVNETLNIIYKEKPDYVGTNIFSVNKDLVQKIIESCNIKTNFIIGGKSTKFLYKEIINFKTPNSIIVTIGEGELITPDIVKDCVKEHSIVNKYNNRKVYKVDNQSIYLPKDISKLKLDRSFFENRQITNIYGEVEEAIVTSRECLYNCAFCGGARSLNSDVPVRTRNKENIIKELLEIKTKHPNTTSIRVLDDLFLKNRNSIKDAIDIFNKFDYEWRAMAHIKSIIGSEDLLSKLKESGCKELEIGIESGNDEMRKIIHKVGSKNDVYNTIINILRSGINVKGYIMYGLPNETYEQCKETFTLAKDLYDMSLLLPGKFRASSFQFRPYHGTELYNKINREIVYEHNDSLNELSGRQQFNFSAGNFSNCPQVDIDKFVIDTNLLGEENEYEKQNNKMSKL